MFKKRKKYRLISLNPRKTHSLEQAASLSELYGKDFLHITSVYFSPGLIRFLKSVIPRYINFFRKRSHPRLKGKYVALLPRTEIVKQRWDRKKKTVDFFELSEIFQKDVISKVTPPEVCISYDTSSYLIFERWKGRSKLILDLSIGVSQYRVKIDHKGNYNPAMLGAKSEDEKRLFAIYDKEVALADIILCGSEFVKQSVEFINPDYGKKCRVLVYGVNTTDYGFPDRIFNKSKTLKFVFAGGRVSWRKGSDKLINAWKKLNEHYPDCELHFFGTIEDEIDISAAPKNVFFHGRVNKEVLIAQLKQMDVFVFPSTFEGGSVAVLEAMALQLPIITTLNSVDVLTQGESGEIVEAGDEQQLTKAMIKLIENPEYRETIAKRAYSLAINHYTWDNYKQNLGNILTKEGFL
jgi:glycosyltransferase involved in cell wall biosynthesis